MIMSEYSFDAVIFDLDGVVTQTARVHSLAWKRMFDDYLRLREEKYGEPFKEFTHEKDYLSFVDGKPRYKGVESFLISRGINLDFGDPSDSPDAETICGLGNKKDSTFNAILADDGVKVYDTTVEMIKNLKSRGIKLGVASSSKNCKPVLKAAGLLELFGTRVDGVVSAELNLKGKPEPDIFTTACDNLCVDYKKAIIVTSDGDFSCLVEYLIRKNKLRSVIASSKGGCSHLLEKAAGTYISYMDELRNKLEYHKY